VILGLSYGQAAGAVTSNFLPQYRYTGAALTFCDPQTFAPRRASADLCAHFRVESLAAFGVGELTAGLGAAAAALAYLRATQGDALGHLTRLQRLTGAQLVASAGQAEVLRSGVPSKDDPQFGVLKGFSPARVDRIVGNGEMVRVGNVAVFATATPGHTDGALTWHWGSCDGGICRQIVYADSLTPVSADGYRFTDHPLKVSAFRASLARLASLDCDILISPHPGASQMPQRFALGRSLLDPDACKIYAATKAKDLDERLAKEAAPAEQPKP